MWSNLTCQGQGRGHYRSISWGQKSFLSSYLSSQGSRSLSWAIEVTYVQQRCGFNFSVLLWRNQQSCFWGVRDFCKSGGQLHTSALVKHCKSNLWKIVFWPIDLSCSSFGYRISYFIGDKVVVRFDTTLLYLIRGPARYSCIVSIVFITHLLLTMSPMRAKMAAWQSIKNIIFTSLIFCWGRVSAAWNTGLGLIDSTLLS